MKPAIEKAENKLAYLSSDEETMNAYWERERSLHERANMISSAEQRGIEKKAIEVAENLLKLGVELEIVAKGSGLSIEKVTEIYEKINIK